MATHWIKKCETCPFRATPTILAGPNGIPPQGYYLDWLLKGSHFNLEAKALLGTDWIKKCETCPFRATPTIIACPNDLYP